MAFIRFNEGANHLGEGGLPSTWTLDLSTKSTAELTTSATFAGGFGKATGTGYEAKTETRPSPTNGEFAGTQVEWKTEANTNWSSAVKSVVLRNGETNLVCAWDLAATRAMNAANTTLKFTPKINL